MSTVQEIEQAVMKLSRKNRVHLAQRLFQSLETKAEKKVAEAWADEASARADAYRKGTLKSVSVGKAFGFEA